MNAPQPTQAEQLYRAARELVPQLRERTAQTAALGRLPDDTIDAMQAAGFFRIMQPARYGGFEMDPEVFFRVQMILAEGCMSTAWVLGVVAILDPPRPEVATAMAEAESAGIQVVMITGDAAATALAIAGKVGLVQVVDEPALLRVAGEV